VLHKKKNEDCLTPRTLKPLSGLVRTVTCFSSVLYNEDCEAFRVLIAFYAVCVRVCDCVLLVLVSLRIDLLCHWLQDEDDIVCMPLYNSCQVFLRNVCVCVEREREREETERERK
jgi:hypothetical protein